MRRRFPAHGPRHRHHRHDRHDPARRPTPPPAPPHPAAPDPGPTATTGTTEVAAPPPTDTPQPTAPDTARRLDIDGETTWQEVFDTFAASEQSCSREALGGERLHSLLEQRVVEGDMDGGEWSLFSCLE
ncbi:MAG: hypothetical protein OXE75_14190, partial [bacterium]|nr:hypothetical protein [bacterium]